MGVLQEGRETPHALQGAVAALTRNVLLAGGTHTDDAGKVVCV